MNATFEKLTSTDKRLYGPQKLLLCGFPAKAHSAFQSILEMSGLGDVPVVWVSREQANETVSNLMSLPSGNGTGVDSTLPRAVIVGGIAEKMLHRLMNVCRQSGMKAALWAVVTPVSETWTLQDLLTELQEERRAMAMARGKQPEKR